MGGIVGPRGRQIKRGGILTIAAGRANSALRRFFRALAALLEELVQGDMPREKPEKIAEIYDRIFKNDPLLITKENQVEYGKALLRHLLINRTVTSCNPEQVLVHKPETWPLFDQVRPAKPPKPAAALVTRYRISRRDRDDFQYTNARLDKASLKIKRDRDFAELGDFTLVSRGAKTDERRKHFAFHDVASAELRGQVRSHFGRRLRIAAVGYRIQISKLENEAYLDEELVGLPRIDDRPIDGLSESVGFRELSRTKANPKVLAKWQRAIRGHITAALQSRCHFIVVPEFALPADSTTFDVEQQILKLCQATKHSFFLFGGSRHEGGYNRGPVFCRTFPIDADAKPQAGPLLLSSPNEKAWWHYKFAPARKLGENTLGRWGSKVPNYKVRVAINPEAVNLDDEMANFSVAIAICYDSFDPTMFLNIVMQCRTSKSPSIILVPSFNTSDEFVALLRDLSFLAQATVVYVNGLHGDARMFICGVSVSELLAKANVLARTIGQHLRTAKNKHEGLLAAHTEGESDTKELDAAKARLNALDNLHDKIQIIRKRGALQHLITVEQGLGSANHGDLYVASDLIYYNIDTELLTTLATFRKDFFSEEEEFLVAPLQGKALNDAAALIVALRENQEIEREARMKTKPNRARVVA